MIQNGPFALKVGDRLGEGPRGHVAVRRAAVDIANLSWLADGRRLTFAGGPGG